TSIVFQRASVTTSCTLNTQLARSAPPSAVWLASTMPPPIVAIDSAANTPETNHVTHGISSPTQRKLSQITPNEMRATSSRNSHCCLGGGGWANSSGPDFARTRSGAWLFEYGSDSIELVQTFTCDTSAFSLPGSKTSVSSKRSPGPRSPNSQSRKPSTSSVHWPWRPGTIAQASSSMESPSSSVGTEKRTTTSSAVSSPSLLTMTRKYPRSVTVGSR